MQQKPPEALVKEMHVNRDKLRAKKPAVHAKLMRYLDLEAAGETTALSLMDWALDFGCNFNCTHCCASVFRGDASQQLPARERIRHVADQADALGIFVINLIGGEPLIWPDLEGIIETIGAHRFHISLTTNGWLLTPELAGRLARAGVDKVGVSIDSGIPEEHDSFRGAPGSFERAVQAVINAREAGIRAMISTVVTHQNIRGEGFEKLLELSLKLDVPLDLQCATVSGNWRGNMEALIDEEDARLLSSLRERLPLLRRDVWSVPGSQGGCPAAARSFYVIPSGDVLPCLFIHVSFGNVYTEPLADIQRRMIGVREFRQRSPMCLAGEDRGFIERYLTKTYGLAVLPINHACVFEDVKEDSHAR